MIKQLFATMHEALDEIMQLYPHASERIKDDLTQKLSILKAMSTTFIEEWLQFEEKLEKCGEMMLFQSEVIPILPPYWDKLKHPLCQSKEFLQGEGYFMLQMFDRAARVFEQLIARHPDFLLARFYLAYAYANKKRWKDAYRQFEEIALSSGDPKLKSFSAHAMQTIEKQMGQSTGQNPDHVPQKMKAEQTFGSHGQKDMEAP